LRPGLCPFPTDGAVQRSRKPLNWIWGRTGEGGNVRGGKGRGREGRERKERGGQTPKQKFWLFGLVSNHNNTLTAFL